MPNNKPPKLRFKPSQYVEYQNSLWEIMYAYRTKDDDRIWKFCLEERKGLSRKDNIGHNDLVGQFLLNYETNTDRIA